MARPAGRAIVELVLRGQNDVRRQLSQLTDRFAAFGLNVAKAGSALAGAAVLASAAAIGVLSVKAIQAAKDFGELKNKFDTVFGNKAADIQQWADNYASAMGRSRKSTMEFLATSKGFFGGLGFGADMANEYAMSLTALANDFASFNNITPEEAFDRFRAALAGSSEVLDTFGINVRDVAVKAELLRQGLDPNKATEMQKVMARYNIILQSSADAHGDAARTADSFANQLVRARAMAEDFLIQIGNALLPIMQKLMTILLSAATLLQEQWGPALATAADSAEDWASNNEKLLEQIDAMVRVIAAATSFVTFWASAFIGLASAMTYATSAALKLSAAQQAMQGNFGNAANLYKAGRDAKMLAEEFDNAAMALAGMTLSSMQMAAEGIGVDVIREKMAQQQQAALDAAVDAANRYTTATIEGDSIEQAQQEQMRNLAAEKAKVDRDAAMERRRAEEQEIARLKEQYSGMHQQLEAKRSEAIDGLTRLETGEGALSVGSLASNSVEAFRQFATNAQTAGNLEQKRTELMAQLLKVQEEQRKLLADRDIAIARVKR